MDPRARLRDNPFFVLGMSVGSTSMELERAARRLLSELAVGREASRTYSTPFGCMERTPENVRAAVDALRDPAKRIRHEWWAAVPVSADPPRETLDVPAAQYARLLGLRCV